MDERRPDWKRVKAQLCSGGHAIILTTSAQHCVEKSEASGKDVLAIRAIPRIRGNGGQWLGTQCATQEPWAVFLAVQRLTFRCMANC